jgi:hypothetical protein
MMTIKNNSSETKQAVLLRFAAFVPDHALSSGNFTRITTEPAIAYGVTFRETH